MRIPVPDQSSASGFIDWAANVKNNFVSLKEGTQQSIEVIATLSGKILEFIDWVSTILLNPIIILTAIDKLAIVAILSLLLLKMLGFDNLEKWILLSILIKVISMVLI